MNNKFNRIVATGLLALMIANFSACKDNDVINNKNDNTTTGQNQTIVNPTQSAKGDVWEAMKVKGTHIAKSSSYDYSLLQNQPLPIQFLEDEGLLYRNHSNRLCINDKQPSPVYSPLETHVYIDNNTTENDVYVLLNYKSGIIDSGADEDVFVTTWKLKYTLDDDDYQTLLKLNGDYRQRFFIQEMDLIYEPQVISKATTTQQIVNMGSPVKNKKQNIFPYVYVDGYDLNNKTIKFASMVDGGYKYYEANLYEAQIINTLMERYNITREECLGNMHMTTQSTLLGSALTKFHIAGYSGGFTDTQAAEQIKNSKEQVVWESLDVNSQEKNVELTQ